MMTRFVLTLLIGLVVSLGALVSLGTSVAFAETVECRRYSDDTLGFTTYSAFESWFPKSISLDIYGWKSRSGYKALTKEENRKKYRLLPNGKMIAGMKPNPGFKTVDNVRYKCDRTSLQLTAGLERKSGDTQTADASSSASYSSTDGLCNKATRDGKWTEVISLQYFVEKARKRGLSCGVGEPASFSQVESGLGKASDTWLLFSTCAGGDWANKQNQKSPYLEYFNEAKKRGLRCPTISEAEYVEIVSDGEVCEYYNDLFNRDGTQQRLSWIDKELKSRGFRCDVVKRRNSIQVVSEKPTLQSDSNQRATLIAAQIKYGSRKFKQRISLQIVSMDDEQICGIHEGSILFSAASIEQKYRGLTCGVGETTQTASASAPVPKAKPKATSAALTASQKEAERLRQELAALRAEKAKQQQTISSDTKLPTITIASANTKSKQGIIRGRARDNTGIAEVTIGGRPVPFDASGNFRFETFVPVGGKQVVIQVTDLNGLSDSKTVKLNRSASNTTTSITFESLNPLGRKVAKNKDALALIIGVDDYENTPARAIYADSDAKVFADYANEKLGIPSNRIKTLVNDGADEKGMLLAVKDWLSRASKKDKSDVYVFFAGHALASQDGEKMYLLPYDGSPRLLEKTAILRDELFQDIAAANPRSVTVFLDTCYSGETRGNEMLIAGRPIGIRVLEQSIPDNFTLMTAAAGDQIANPLKEAKHGMFSYFLMKGMEGVADSNQDNKITALELHEYVKENVWQQSSNKQLPELQGDENRVLVQFQ